MPRSILLVDTYYPALLQDHGLASAPSDETDYASALEAALDIGFGTSGAYARGLQAQGWDAQVVIPNSRTLQTLWAREQRMRRRWSAGWMYGNHLARVPVARDLLRFLPAVQGTLVEQIERLRPDVLYVQDINLLPPSAVRHLRRHAGLVVGEHASPLPPRAYLDAYDLVVSALPSIVEAVRGRGGDAEWLPLGVDRRWANSSPASSRPIEAIFVGSFTRLQPSTAPLLRAVAQRVPGLEIYGQADPAVLREAGLDRYYRGPAWGREMFELLGRSRLVVNRHGSIAGEYAANMRMYEATGSGAALLTEGRRNLGELFVPGEEVLAYGGAEEAADMAAALLGDPVGLDALAAAGHVRTMRDHTYDTRAERLVELFESRLASRPAC